MHADLVCDSPEKGLYMVRQTQVLEFPWNPAEHTGSLALAVHSIDVLGFGREGVRGQQAHGARRIPFALPYAPVLSATQGCYTERRVGDASY